MPSIADLLDPFSRARRGEGKKRSGVQRYGERLLRFDRWLEERGNRDVITIDHIVVADYRDDCMERGNKASTVECALITIRAFAKWAVRLGHMAADPTVDLVWPPRQRGAPKPLATLELAKLWTILEAEPDSERQRWHHRRNRLACHLMYYVGMRLSEVCRLRVADVNLAAGVITIRDSKSQDRSVLIHAEFIGELAEALAGKKLGDLVITTQRGGQLTPKVLAHVFERWLPARGLRISAHRLRHSFGTELLRASGNLAIVQDAMGHASPETTRMYTLVVVEDQRPAIAAFPPLSRFAAPPSAD
jgi:integrase/recombinase XerC